MEPPLFTVSAMEINAADPNPGEGPAVKKRRKQGRRACQACRAVKMRCDVSDDSGAVCSRCKENETACVFLPSQRGKWARKKVDAPAAEHGTATASTSAIASSSTVPGSVNYLPPRPPAPPTHSRTPSFHLQPPASSVAPNLAFAQPLPESTVSPEGSSFSRAASTSYSALSSPRSQVRPKVTSASEETKDYEGRLHFKLDHSLTPLGLLAEASMGLRASDPVAEEPPESDASQTGWSEAVAPLGIANSSYFGESLAGQLLPPSLSARAPPAPPSIVSQGIITHPQASQLFKIYFEKLNPLRGLLDEHITTPSACAQRAPFLFMAICAVSSRYLQGGILYSTLFHHAQKAGMEAMLQAKSTSTVQGFLILASWSQPTATYEADNTWLFAGIAIRMAYEIGLHRKNVLTYPAEMDEATKLEYRLEILNRERTWFCSVVLDRVMCSITGKPQLVYETWMVRNAEWWCDQPGCTLSDVHLSAEMELMRIVFRTYDVMYSSTQSVSGIATDIDYLVVCRDATNRFEQWGKRWSGRLASFFASTSNGPLALLQARLQFSMNFFKLVIFTIPLTHIMKKGDGDIDAIGFASPCFEMCRRIVAIARDELAPALTFKFCPDQTTIQLTYAALWALRLLAPEHKNIFDRDAVFAMAEDAAAVLQSGAEDERHAPYLYGTFVRKQIDLWRRKSPEPPIDAPSLNATDEVLQATMRSAEQDYQEHFLRLPSTNATLSSDWIDEMLSRANPFFEPLNAASPNLFSMSGGGDFSMPSPGSFDFTHSRF